MVVPVHNESGNVVALLDEIAAALTGVARFEAIFVDDLSSDNTADLLVQYARAHPWLVVVRHRNNCGQSTAVRTGIREACAPLIATLDGDGQNDPADIPAMLARWRVLHEARREALVRHLPDFLEPDSELLRVTTFVQAEFGEELLGLGLGVAEPE
ncbi:MAG TPA: glycosyltransferase family 2 protein, partial [Burkholderiaceae bacterium]|nr:glycosyltransferase family 2 protein [Burkholderiaceae bacterium]